MIPFLQAGWDPTSSKMTTSSGVEKVKLGTTKRVLPGLGKELQTRTKTAAAQIMSIQALLGALHAKTAQKFIVLRSYAHL